MTNAVFSRQIMQAFNHHDWAEGLTKRSADVYFAWLPSSKVLFAAAIAVYACSGMIRLCFGNSNRYQLCQMPFLASWVFFRWAVPVSLMNCFYLFIVSAVLGADWDLLHSLEY